MEKRDVTIEELKKYDGTREDKRILVAVNGKVFDVTEKGSKFYGKGGPYEMFAGRDASRGLACMSMIKVKDTYDDLSDLTVTQRECLDNWDKQFTEKYVYVGKLLPN